MLTPLAIHLLFSWIQGLAQTCPSSYSLRNTKLKGHANKTYSVIKSSYHCSVKCASQEGCHSINYCPSQGICELNNANHLSNPESVVYSAGCQYLNYFVRAVSRCSNKLCSYPLECEMDKNGQEYKCKSCNEKHKILKFPKKAVTDYVIYENPFVQPTSFTLSMWVQVDTSTDFHTILSYARINVANEIAIMYTSGIWMIINDQRISLVPSVYEGEWHHICATWTNVDGSYLVYLDGILKGQGNVKTGHVIQGGTVILGQDQDSYKGGFHSSQSLQGNLTGVNMWDRMLTADEVSALASRCSTAEGNIIKWTDFHDKIIDIIQGLENSKFQANINKGHSISNGTVILGQDQDSYKGSFQSEQSLQGNLTGVNMWDKVFTAEEVSALGSRCSTAEGNIIKWTDFFDKIIGKLKLVCS